jgi:hypothetical protein
MAALALGTDVRAGWAHTTYTHETASGLTSILLPRTHTGRTHE